MLRFALADGEPLIGNMVYRVSSPTVVPHRSLDLTRFFILFLFLGSRFDLLCCFMAEISSNSQKNGRRPANIKRKNPQHAQRTEKRPPSLSPPPPPPTATTPPPPPLPPPERNNNASNDDVTTTMFRNKCRRCMRTSLETSINTNQREDKVAGQTKYSYKQRAPPGVLSTFLCLKGAFAQGTTEAF